MTPSIKKLSKAPSAGRIDLRVVHPWTVWFVYVVVLFDSAVALMILNGSWYYECGDPRQQHHRRGYPGDAVLLPEGWWS